MCRQIISHLQQATFENIVAKRKLLMISNFSFFPYISTPFDHYTSIFQYFCLDVFNPFSHTTILQQTTLNIFCQNIENLYNWMDNQRLKLENIVAKGEIARFEQFLLLSLCFQKAVCYRGVRKRLYEGKG